MLFENVDGKSDGLALYRNDQTYQVSDRLAKWLDSQDGGKFD